MFKLILCCDNNYGIGKDNKLPWCVKKEMEIFRNKTIKNGRNCVIMGANTYFSIPQKYRPLCYRKNFVLTSNPSKYEINDTNDTNDTSVIWKNSFEDTIEFIRSSAKYDDVWVIGGEYLYNHVLKHHMDKISEIHMSVLDKVYDCDTYLNIFDYGDFECVERYEYDKFDHMVYIPKEEIH